MALSVKPKPFAPFVNMIGGLRLSAARGFGLMGDKGGIDFFVFIITGSSECDSCSASSAAKQNGYGSFAA